MRYKVVVRSYKERDKYLEQFPNTPKKDITVDSRLFQELDPNPYLFQEDPILGPKYKILYDESVKIAEFLENTITKNHSYLEIKGLHNWERYHKIYSKRKVWNTNDAIPILEAVTDSVYWYCAKLDIKTLNFRWVSKDEKIEFLGKNAVYSFRKWELAN